MLFVKVIIFFILICHRFGNLGGFQILLERFQSGKNLTVTVIYALIRPFGLCYEFLTVHTIVKYFMPIVVSKILYFLMFWSGKNFEEWCLFPKNHIFVTGHWCSLNMVCFKLRECSSLNVAKAYIV